MAIFVILLTVATVVAAILLVAFQDGAIRAAIIVAWLVAASWTGSNIYVYSGAGATERARTGSPGAAYTPPPRSAPAQPAEPASSTNWTLLLKSGDDWVKDNLLMLVLAGGGLLIAFVVVVALLARAGGAVEVDHLRARVRRYRRGTIYGRGDARTLPCTVRWPWVILDDERFSLAEAEPDRSVDDRFHWPDGTTIDFYFTG